MSISIPSIRQQLRQLSTPENAQSVRRFFKEELVCYGVKTPQVNQLAKSYVKEIRNMEKAEVLALCNQLWESGMHEEAIMACTWSETLAKKMQPEDFAILEKWIKTNVSNWASCDTLCNHTLADFVLRYPQFILKLKEFARSNNRWVRRAAAVTLIIPARRGHFLNDIFDIADTLLTDPDDLVQKGYGWMLKAASESHQAEVFGYVMRNKATMPRTALRYAIEKMPAELKKLAMMK
ncbi:MAG: DNA alkylation repair protein [Mangrovibacterium sp.]